MNGTPNGSDGDLLIGGEPFNLDLESIIPNNDANPQTTPNEGGAGGESGGAQIPDNVARMIADTTRRATEAEERARRAEQAAEELRRSQSQPYTGAPQPPPQNPQAVRDQLARQLNDRFMQNPGETLADMLLLQQQIAQSTAQGAAAGVASGQAELIINGFVQEKANDPAFSIVKDAFTEMLNEARTATTPEQLARATPQQIRQSLEGLYERAAGRAALQNLQKRGRDNFPPAYSTGASGAAGGARTNSGPAGQNEMTPRDATERELLESARSYNMSEEHILAALRAHREDNQ